MSTNSAEALGETRGLSFGTGSKTSPSPPWRTADQVELATARWVDWWNRERLHSACGDAPPAEFEATYHRPQWLVTHYPHGHNNDHYSILHEEQWKLIRNWADGSSELYDLTNDLAESKNLATEQPERVKAMSAELDRRLDEYSALRSKVVGP